jgi:hypothetical protein
MNYRKHKQAINQKKKRMYTPEGYLKDPPDAQCPYCGETRKSCSNVNSLSRAWARDACAKKHKNIKRFGPDE